MKWVKEYGPEYSGQYYTKVFDGVSIYPKISIFSLDMWEVDEENEEVVEWLDESTTTPSGEKKKKVLKSESIPEFDEALESMTQEQKDRVDKALGESMEDVLKKEIANNQQRMLLEDTFVIHRHNGIEYRTILERVVLSSMQRWADIQCATKEAAIKELVEGLDRIVGSMALERAERFDLNNSAKYLITKYKTP